MRFPRIPYGATAGKGTSTKGMQLDVLWSRLMSRSKAWTETCISGLTMNQPTSDMFILPVPGPNVVSSVVRYLRNINSRR